jgi:ParB family chromosome partitioning protein
MNTTTTTQDAQVTQDGTWVAIQDIAVPADARVHSPEDVDSRAQSMAKEGQLQNILLSKEGDRLVLVYGHGRLESAKKLGWDKIRADVKEGLSETQKLLMTLAENEERENANPLYTAGLYKKIRYAEGLSADGLVDKMGKKKSAVYNYLMLADLPRELQEISTRVEIGLHHWLEIAKLPTPEAQVQLAQECAEKGYSVRELQARVKQLQNPKPEGCGEPVNTVTDVKPIRFSWKDGKLAVKIQPVDPSNLQGFLIDVELEWKRFVDLHPAPAMPKKAEEVAQAA